MLSKFASLLLGAVTLSSAFPMAGKRAVTALNEAAFEEAQPRDNTATRALSAVEIQVCFDYQQFTKSLQANMRRRPQENVSPLMNSQVTSVPTSHLFKSRTVTAAQVNSGTL